MSSSIKQLKVVVDGLAADTRYRYEIFNKGGNWPVKVSSLSGLIFSRSETEKYNISTYVEFCPTTGLCPPGSSNNIFYNVPLSDTKAGASVDRTNLYAIIGVAMYDDNNTIVLNTEYIAECDDCLPSIALSGESVVQLDSKTSNSSILSIKATNLIPNQKYNYYFDVLDANWPLQLSPLSGTIQTSQDSYHIKSKFRFCAKNDDCENVLDHSMMSNCDPGQAQFAAIKVRLEPEASNYQSSSDFDFTISCDDCVKYTSISIPSSVDLNRFTTNKASVNILFKNLILGKNYRYAISNVDANWPFIVSPNSGIMTAFESEMSIPVKIIACASTGVCPSHRDDVLDYETDLACLSDGPEALKHAKLNVSLIPVDSSNDQSDCHTITSNQLTITCDNCIGGPRPVLPNIATINYQNKYNGNLNISNLIPGKKYDFFLVSTNSNWPTRLYPNSGSFVADANFSLGGLDSSSIIIPFEMSFCDSTGLCPPNDPYVLPFSLTSESVQKKNFRTSVIANIVPHECDAQTSTSNTMIVVCNECSPKTIVSLSPDINLTSTTQNKGSFSLSLSNMIPGARYSYVLNSIDANWPVIVTPISGTIVSASASSNIPIDITFCRSTGICSGNTRVLPYLIDPACLINYNTIDRYIRLQAVVTNLDDSGDVILSNAANIECTDCLPRTRVSLPSNLVLTESGGETLSSTASISNLIPGQRYLFNFHPIASTWPTKLYPQSGSFTADTSTFSMPFDIAFCRSSGSCVDNVLPYILDNTDNTHTTSVSLNIIPENCSSIEASSSNIMTVTCRQCIPLSRVVLPVSSVVLTNNLYNTSGICSNLIPGQKYNYSIDTIYSNWPTVAYPQSGTFIADNTSSGIIPFQISFCRNTGVCPPGSNGVLPFTLDNSVHYLDGRDIKTSLSLTIESSDSLSLPKITSNTLTVACNNCLPAIKASIPNTISLASSNTSTTNLTLSNTVVGRQYSYSITGLGANWPVSLYPASGTVIASSTTTTIPIKISFCRSSGLCPQSDPSILPYNIRSGAYYGNNLDRSARFRFNVIDLDANIEINSNETIATCENCIPAISITHATNSVSLSSVGNTRHQLTSTLQNLVAGERYTYNINYVDANWPTLVHPQSGVFTATSSTRTISTDIQFCFPSGGCVGSVGSMPYSFNNTISSSRYIKFNMNIDDTTVSNAPIRSEDFTLSCSNCFPSTNYAILMSGAPNLTFPISCCTGTRVMRVDVTGAIPGDTHRYEMVSSVPTISFVPDSGRFVIRPNGSGTFLNMMTSTMPSGTSAIVSCRIVNESSNIESTDFMVVRCSTGC